MGDTNQKEGNTFLHNLIDLDKSLSSSLSLSASASSPLGHYRPHMKFLEYSCHGAFWIPGAIILLWFSEDSKKEAFFFNLILALIVDILCVAVMKAAIGRKRPDNNDTDDMLMTYSVDKMSCPSGHTSRAVMLTFVLISSSPHLYLLHPLLLAWCLCTCASRVLLGRHHIGDVLIGIVLGYTEYWFIDYIWAGPATAKWYLDIFRDSNSVIDDL